MNPGPIINLFLKEDCLYLVLKPLGLNTRGTRGGGVGLVLLLTRILPGFIYGSFFWFRIPARKKCNNEIFFHEQSVSMSTTLRVETYRVSYHTFVILEEKQIFSPF
uniref:Uncharacterized protein n=1 Tax=Cacopsylla melanoneura TaxID=428564 RepID=A0A8D9AIF9_9HEMI